MFGDQTSSRWIALAGVGVGLSMCAACFLVILVFTSAYGGQTVALRNPFAPPAPVVSDNSGSGNTGGNVGTTGGGSTSGGTVSGDTGSSGNTSGGSVGSTAGNNTSSGNTTGGSVPSGSSASNYLPSLAGYTTADAGSIQGAIDLIAATGGFASQSASDDTFSAQSLSLGTIATSVIVSRVDDFIACYRNVGAVDAQVYIRADILSLASGEIPPLGAVVVVNETLLRDNLITCAVSPNDPNTFSAQASQPCGNFGSFTRGGQTFTYLYAGTAQSFCDQVSGYYTRLGG